MIGVFLKPGLFARQSFEMAFRTLGSSLLQTLAQRMMPRAIGFNEVSAERLTGTVRGQIDDAEVYPQCLKGVVGRRFWHIQRDRKGERPVAIEQIGLPFDAVESRRLIATNTERNENAPMNRQQRNGIQAFEAHNPLVKGDCPICAKGGFDALVAFIGLSDLANGTDRHLSRQSILSPYLSIDQFLQFKLVGKLFRNGRFRNGIAGRIERVHRVKQRVRLFWRWSQFQKHRLFHRRRIAYLKNGVNSTQMPIPSRPKRKGLLTPWLKTRGFCKPVW